jgi:signal transduction histidine kinase
VTRKAKEAIEFMQENRYRLVLLDWRMPGIGGPGILKTVQEAGLNIPFIILSAYDEPEHKSQALQLGAKAFLNKPQNREQWETLKQTVLEVISKKEADTLPLTQMSRLTGGIVHDMRSGLGVIRNTIGFLFDDLAGSNHQADLLKITRSLDFCVNLEAIVREIYFILERKLVDIDLALDFEPDMPDIVADEGQMKQVFMNLINNAGEAMPDGGALTVRARREGDLLTGCGISPENQRRLFHEFFTTKDQGYGLGLHIVSTIVKRHGGTITVESKIGEGTTFILHLPIEVE